MPDYDFIYNHRADQYQLLVNYEDYEGNLLRAIQEITPIDGIDILETGAGTGRVTCLLAPRARSIRAFDLSAHMLDVARSRVATLGYDNVKFAVGDHRSLPVETASADLIISGWSFCYVYLSSGTGWRAAIDRALADFKRFLRPGGKIILIETLGTGCKEPFRYPSLIEYLNYLDEIGFRVNSIRTDFRFDTVEQARELSAFFFDDEILKNLEGVVLPECTGLWWQE